MALILEVDGDIHDLQQEEDARREKVLHEMGLNILRFKNDEILRDTSRSMVVKRIKGLVQFNDLVKQTHQQANESGLKPTNISPAVARARGRK